MDKLDKVIKGLECCTLSCGSCNECPYRNEDCEEGNTLMRDALALLKAQAPTKVINLEDDGRFGLCPRCHLSVRFYDQFCNHCGQAVKWDG